MQILSVHLRSFANVYTVTQTPIKIQNINLTRVSSQYSFLFHPHWQPLFSKTSFAYVEFHVNGMEPYILFCVKAFCSACFCDSLLFLHVSHIRSYLYNVPLWECTKICYSSTDGYQGCFPVFTYFK